MLTEEENEMHLRFLMKENESGFQKAREEGRKEGKEEGREEGRKEGKEEGRIENRNEIVKRMDGKGYSDEMILDVTGITADELERIRKESGNG